MQGRPMVDGHKPSSQWRAESFIHSRPHDMRNEGISTRSRRSLWCECRACRKHVEGRAFPDSHGADRPRRSPSRAGQFSFLVVVCNEAEFQAHARLAEHVRNVRQTLGGSCCPTAEGRFDDEQKSVAESVRPSVRRSSRCMSRCIPLSVR